MDNNNQLVAPMQELRTRIDKLIQVVQSGQIDATVLGLVEMTAETWRIQLGVKTVTAGADKPKRTRRSPAEIAAARAAEGK